MDENNLDKKIEESAGRINKSKPQLLPFFRNAYQFVSGLVQIPQSDAGLVIIRSIEKLTLASEFLYIDMQSLFTLALKRGEFSLMADIVYAIFPFGYEYGAVFLSLYPRLSFPLKEIEADVRSFVSQVREKVKKGGSVLEFCLSFRESRIVSCMLQQFGFIGAWSSGSLPEILEIIKKNIKTYPWPLVEKWLSRGTDLLTSNRADAGVKFLLLRSRESRWLLGIHKVVLEDLKNVLKIYCASLSGKEMVITGLDSSGFGFSSPYTDGRTIFLPQELGFFAKPEYNERAYTVIAAYQAASIKLKTFEFDLSAIDFKDQLRDRYGTQLPAIMENVRKQYGKAAENIRERPDGEIEIVFRGGRKLLILDTDHEKFYYSFPTPGFARDLFIITENARIGHHLSKSYAGLKEDFKLVRHYLWIQRPEIRPMIQISGDEREARFLLAVECLIQFSLAGKWKGDPGDEKLVQTVREICAVFSRIRSDTATVQDTAKITFALYNLFYDNFPIVRYFSENSLDNSFSSLLQPELHPEVVLDVSPDLLKEENESPQQPDEENRDERDKDKSIDLASIKDTRKEDDSVKELMERGGLKIFKYPEYNISTNAYETDHCTLFERILEPGDSGFCRDVMNQYKLEYKKIKKRFLLMKPEEVEIVRRWESGDEIHMTDAFDYMTDLCRGYVPDEKIYFRKINNKRDIAVAVLVDASSSTMEQVGTKPIIRIEKEALCILSSALAVIGDTFGIFSFFSMGRNRIFFNIVKNFDEEWNALVKSRIHTISSKASNRDGCAVRHATARLLEMPHRTKLLFLLSDGIPADLHYGSGSSGETNLYAIEDTRRAIIEAKTCGIIPYCITIDRFARKYIPHLYGDFSYAIIDDVRKLPGKLSRLYLKLTR